MPEIRKDPIIDRWAIIAAERAGRPGARPAAGVPLPVGPIPCPFDAGNEALTPPESFADRGDDGVRWQVRVVPNKFPALTPDARSNILAHDFFTAVPAHGAHEVIIESPDHTRQLATLSPDAMQRVLRTFQQRIRHHSADPAIRYVALYKNHGTRGGATLPHTHSQLLALPIVPRLVAEEVAAAARYHGHTGRCVYCDLVAGESAGRSRVVAEHRDALVVCAYAPRSPYEMWILPKAHAGAFEAATPAVLQAVGELLQDALRRMNTVLADPAYNLTLHTAPRGTAAKHYHWHIELLPCSTHHAGLEIGSECYINIIAPETAAAELRNADTDRL